MKENSSKSLVYFDVNALNYLCDIYKGKSKKPFRKYNVLLSWPILDEINCNSSFAKTVDLANFIHSIYNKKVLKTIKDMLLMEVSAFLKNDVLSLNDYFDSDDSHITALNDARKRTMPNHIRSKLRSDVGNKKDMVKLRERHHRKNWRQHFGEGKTLPASWSEFYPILVEEKYFNEVLYCMIETYHFKSIFNKRDIMQLSCRKLRCLNLGVKFYVALQYFIDSQPKKLGSPDRGDLPDMQHVFYLGLCDYFVTNDNRVFEILNEINHIKKIEITSAENFYRNCLLSSNKGRA